MSTLDITVFLFLFFFFASFKLSVLGRGSRPRIQEKHFKIAPIPWLCCLPDKRTNWLHHVTVTLCTAWSIQALKYLFDSLVLLAHRQCAVLPSQLVDNQSCHSSFSVPSRFLVSHAVDHNTPCICRPSSSRQSYCCRESYSHPGRLLARRALKQRSDISKLSYNISIYWGLVYRNSMKICHIW